MSSASHRPKAARPVDEHVGARIRAARNERGVSQHRLAKALHISVAAVQKYEDASSRISASRLYAIALLLDRPVSYFFDEAPIGRSPPGHADDAIELQRRIATDAEFEVAVQEFAAIADPERRRAVAKFIRMMNDPA